MTEQYALRASWHFINNELQINLSSQAAAAHWSRPALWPVLAGDGLYITSAIVNDKLFVKETKVVGYAV